MRIRQPPGALVSSSLKMSRIMPSSWLSWYEVKDDNSCVGSRLEATNVQLMSLVIMKMIISRKQDSDSVFNRKVRGGLIIKLSSISSWNHVQWYFKGQPLH